LLDFATHNQTPLNDDSANPLAGVMTSSQHVYQVRPRKGHKRGVDLISDGCHLVAGDSVIVQPSVSLP